MNDTIGVHLLGRDWVVSAEAFEKSYSVKKFIFLMSFYNSFDIFLDRFTLVISSNHIFDISHTSFWEDGSYSFIQFIYCENHFPVCVGKQAELKHTEQQYLVELNTVAVQGHV